MKKALVYTEPSESEEQAYAEREGSQIEQERAAEDRRRREREAQELAAHAKILADGIKPLQREENPMRQLNILITLEQHERITAFARKNRISLKELILLSLRPIVERAK